MFESRIRKIGDLRVVLVKDDRQAVTVEVLIGAGSREESDRQAGTAHFLEHFVFKGTKKFPKMLDVNEAIEKVGGRFNAYTSYDKVGFWVKVGQEHLSLAIKVIGQLTGEALLPKEHFDKERGTILEELHMYEDHPGSKAGMEVAKLLFGEKTSLGRPVIGTVDSLKAMKTTDLRRYMDVWFKPENMIVGVVGNYGDEKELLSLIEAEFGAVLRRKTNLPKQDKYYWKEQTKMRMKLVKRKVEQAHVALALPGLELKNGLRWASYLANDLLGGGWMSGLIKEVREERGWAYSIRSWASCFYDVGSVGVGAGLPKNKLEDALGLILEIIWGIGGVGKWGIKKNELEMAKESYKGRLSLNFDVPEKVLGFALYDLMYENKIYGFSEIVKSIEKVNLEQLREYYHTVFKPEKINLVVVGNYEKMPKIH